MNPSYDNGVGAQQTPQNNPGQQPTSQPGGLGTGTNFGAGGAGFGTGSSLGANPSFGMTPTNTPISSGTGDIVLAGSGSGKKSRKGMIVLIVLITLLILVGGGILLWQSGVFGGINNQPQTQNLEEKYNSYVNYVLFGKDSTEKPELSAMRETTPYFWSLREDVGVNVDVASTTNTNQVTLGLDEYIIKANEKYEILKSAYDAKESEDKLDIVELKSYFQDYAGMKKIDFDKIINKYIEGGKSAAEQMISQNYAVGSNSGEYLNNYLTASINYANTMLAIVEKSEKAGCIQNGLIIENCYKMTEQETKNLGQALSNMLFAERDLYDKALSTVMQIYDELYEADEGSE